MKRQAFIGGWDGLRASCQAQDVTRRPVTEPPQKKGGMGNAEDERVKRGRHRHPDRNIGLFQLRVDQERKLGAVWALKRSRQSETVQWTTLKRRVRGWFRKGDLQKIKMLGGEGARDGRNRRGRS